MSCSVQQTVFQGVWRRQTRLEELGLVEPLPVRVVFISSTHVTIMTGEDYYYHINRLVYHHKVVPSSPKLVINWFSNWQNFTALFIF